MASALCKNLLRHSPPRYAFSHRRPSARYFLKTEPTCYTTLTTVAVSPLMAPLYWCAKASKKNILLAPIITLIKSPAPPSMSYPLQANTPKNALNTALESIISRIKPLSARVMVTVVKTTTTQRRSSLLSHKISSAISAPYHWAFPKVLTM